MTETFSRWDAAEHLRTPDDARLYLEACADEDPSDGSFDSGGAERCGTRWERRWTRASPTRAAVDGYPLFASHPQRAPH